MLENFNDFVNQIYEQSQYYSPERLKTLRDNISLKKAMASVDISTYSPFARHPTTENTVYNLLQAKDQDPKPYLQLSSACVYYPSAATDQSDNLETKQDSYTS